MMIVMSCSGWNSTWATKLIFQLYLPADPVRRTDSIQSRRKVSSLSDRSDNSEPGQVSGGEESPGILSDDHDQPPESPCDSNESDETAKNLPWLRSVTALLNSFNFYCDHQNFCHPYCYRRHMRAASRLVKAVRKVSLDFHLQLQFRLDNPKAPEKFYFG